MNKIHSGVLALVLSIFLIQAADPPSYNSTTNNTIQTENQNLERLQHYILNIRKEAEHPGTVPNIHGKNRYEKLLEKEFIKPLLKLYENQIHREPDYILGNATQIHEDNLKVLSNEELDFLIHGGDSESTEINRRDDLIEENQSDEHIGEILPPDYQKIEQQKHYRRPSFQLRRKSFDDSNFKVQYRKPVIFPGDRFRPEYEPSGEESLYPSEESRNNFGRLPPSEVPGYRIPRRYPPTAREPNYWQNSWSNVRRPRVIFPSDLVAFSTNSNEDPPEWLANDNNLQDVADQEIRDRGTQNYVNTVVVKSTSCELIN